jgi:hypothetical protein
MEEWLTWERQCMCVCVFVEGRGALLAAHGVVELTAVAGWAGWQVLPSLSLRRWARGCGQVCVRAVGRGAADAEGLGERALCVNLWSARRCVMWGTCAWGVEHDRGGLARHADVVALSVCIDILVYDCEQLATTPQRMYVCVYACAHACMY